MPTSVLPGNQKVTGTNAWNQCGREKSDYISGRDISGREPIVMTSFPFFLKMSRNKGLMPKRKKEQRNPRVKHRNKYNRALIKRKSQVHNS